MIGTLSGPSLDPHADTAVGGLCSLVYKIKAEVERIPQSSQALAFCDLALEESVYLNRVRTREMFLVAENNQLWEVARESVGQGHPFLMIRQVPAWPRGERLFIWVFRGGSAEALTSKYASLSYLSLGEYQELYAYVTKSWCSFTKHLQIMCNSRT